MATQIGGGGSKSGVQDASSQLTLYNLVSTARSGQVLDGPRRIHENPARGQVRRREA